MAAFTIGETGPGTATFPDEVTVPLYTRIADNEIELGTITVPIRWTLTDHGMTAQVGDDEPALGFVED